MKKSINKVLAFLALALTVTSCGDYLEMPDIVRNPLPDGTEEPITGDLVFHGTTETLANWENGDKISLFDGKSVSIVENSAGSGAVAEFKKAVSEHVSSWLAFYPATENMASTTAMSSIPTMQKATVGSCQREASMMIAKSSTSRLYFRNLAAEVSVVLDMDDITSITLSATDNTPLTGEFTVDYSNDDPIVEASGTSVNYVTLEGNIERGKEYRFAVLPTHVEGFALVAKNANGEEVAHNVSNNVAHLTAGSILDLGTIKADVDLPKTYRIAHMWLWGGTGAEYDCSKLWDMFEKAGCFDSEDGRGIDALKDDVLEMYPDGTFKNWAGEDARHWWMAFDKSQTPSQYKSLDMSAYYSVLPKNEGTYTINADTITFTHEDGRVTTGTIVGPGTYELPGCSPAKSVTITTMAIKFVLPSAPDDWDHSWDDYGVFYRKPRQLYVELEQMPAGYVTPEESKTVDNVVFVEPADPEPDFDITTLPGSYKVKALRVNGGSGDDPAFVDPVEKSWCWDESIWWESDNRLEITSTTLNYWSGDDEKFWDYKWHGGQSDEVDMSHVYGILPHGETNYSLDIATMEMTIGDRKAKLLAPGTHHFSAGNRDLTIDNGCIAIHFHIMDMVDATPERWTDVDRFVNAPIDWVMIFEYIQQE